MTTSRRLRLVAVLVGLALAAGFAPTAQGATEGATDGATDTTDPFLAKQWGLETIGAPTAWGKSTGAGVRIGIVDTGIDLQHEDLAGRIVASTSCIDTGGDQSKCKGTAQDGFGHGTHVAGIAAAIRGNGKGVAGVAPDADLVVARVFEGATATQEDVLAGIKWVIDNGAKVVNLSLGGAVFVLAAAFGAELAQGVNYAWMRGAVPVVASGNDDLFGAGIGSSEYGDMNALVVGAAGHDGKATNYTSPTGNAKWAILAPGGSNGQTQADDIYSTIWKKDKENQYGYLAGTSMAAPHVTGAVALLLSQGLTKEQAVERILSTADPVPCGPNSDNCRGRLNVARAVGAAS